MLFIRGIRWIDCSRCSILSLWLKQQYEEAVMDCLAKQTKEPQSAQNAKTCLPKKISWWARLQRWRQLRRERYALRDLSDATLKDIGLSREQVRREAKKSSWSDSNWCR